MRHRTAVLRPVIVPVTAPASRYDVILVSSPLRYRLRGRFRTPATTD